MRSFDSGHSTTRPSMSTAAMASNSLVRIRRQNSRNLLDHDVLDDAVWIDLELVGHGVAQ